MDATWIRRAGVVGFLASLGLITYATLAPRPGGGDTPDWLAHVLLFAALGGSAVLAFAGGGRPVAGVLAAMLIALLLGALTEAAQGAISTRTPSLWDWLADAAGAACGVVAGYVILRRTAGGG